MTITARVSFVTQEDQEGGVLGTSFDITVEHDLSEIALVADDICKQLNAENAHQDLLWQWKWNRHHNIGKKKKEVAQV